eukprot:7388813-Prymnesium_polylepis.1
MEAVWVRVCRRQPSIGEGDEEHAVGIAQLDGNVLQLIGGPERLVGQVLSPLELAAPLVQS